MQNKEVSFPCYQIFSEKCVLKPQTFQIPITLNLLIRNSCCMISSTYNSHNLRLLQIFYKSRCHTISSNAFNLISSSKLTITSTSKLFIRSLPYANSHDTTLVIKNSTMTASSSNIHNTEITKRINRVRNVRIHFPFISSLSLQTLSPSIDIPIHCISTLFSNRT